MNKSSGVIKWDPFFFGGIKCCKMFGMVVLEEFPTKKSELLLKVL